MLDLMIWMAMLHDHLVQSNGANKLNLKSPLQDVRSVVVHRPVATTYVGLYFHRQTNTLGNTSRSIRKYDSPVTLPLKMWGPRI